MSNAKGKHVDTAFISLRSLEEKERRVNRDYLAHCFRWSHVLKTASKMKDFSLLDVGCGRQIPLLDVLYSNLCYPKRYVGVDYDKIEPPREFRKVDAVFLEKTDFSALDLKEQFDLVTCFEVAEHVEPAMAWGILSNVRNCMTPQATCLISTPCYDPKAGAAAFHVNEMSYRAFGALLENLGFCVENVWGTFVSKRDLQIVLSVEDRAVYERLLEYYDFGILSTMFAPLYPEISRNCLWRVSKGVFCRSDLFGEVPEGPEHGSSERWTDFVRDLKS